MLIKNLVLQGLQTITCGSIRFYVSMLKLRIFGEIQPGNRSCSWNRLSLWNGTLRLRPYFGLYTNSASTELVRGVLQRAVICYLILIT